MTALFARWRQRIWTLPIALALLSVVGLLSALIGDGAWDAVSWVGLGVPVAVCLVFGLRRAPRAER